MAKGFGTGISEYKEIAEGLQVNGVLTTEQANIMKMLAGYRNRMVHFKATADALRAWFERHPEMADNSL